MYQILLVEDDEKICEVIKDYFDTRSTTDAPYQIDLTVYKDGRSAFELINGCDSCFDLFLLDVMVPFMDGFALCKSIRKR